MMPEFIIEIVEMFQPDEGKVRFKTYLKRLHKTDSELSDDIRELVPSAIRSIYPTYNFKEIMDMKTDDVQVMLGRANTKADGLALDFEGQMRDMQINNLLNNTQHTMSIVNSNCRIFWEDEPDE